MAYITAPQLAGRLPLDGAGLSEEEIQEAIDAAVEEIAGITKDTTGSSALARQAVVNLAMAELFDTKIFPQDARRPGSESSALRQSATRALDAFIKIKSDKDQDPTTIDVPSGYVGTIFY